jgi:hypothetical protein
MLHLDTDYGGAYGDHSCQYQNTMTLHMDVTQPILAGTYNLQIGVLNPRYRAVRDYWAVQLLGPAGYAALGNSTNGTQQNTSVVSSSAWRTATPLLSIEVPGFGISTAWSGETLAAIPTVVVSSAWHSVSKLAVLSSLLVVVIKSLFCAVQLQEECLI